MLVLRFDDCFQFYSQTLGLRVTWGEVGGSYASFESGDGAELSIYDHALMMEAIEGTAADGEQPGRDRAVLVFEVEDLDDMVERLKGSGTVFVTDPHDRPDWGISVAHLRDPDGNLVELSRRLPRDEWSEELAADAERYGWSG